MMYSVYMLPGGHTNRFMNFEWAKAHGGVPFLEYEIVYTGTIEPRETEAETLEAIYTIFNIAHPENYHGRSLSVSDLVALENVGTFFCDSIGFKKLCQ